MDTQQGRPRRYDFQPDPDFACAEAAWYVAALDELLERLSDLLVGTPQEVLDFVPEGGCNSMAMMAIHIAWGEAGWISGLTKADIPDDLLEQLKPGKQGPSGELEPSSLSGDEIIALCRRVREEITRPAVSKINDIQAKTKAGDKTIDARAILMNLIWHWTHSTGQIALIRRLAGAKYQWRYPDQIASQ